jgi:hypothetical protein
MINLRKSTTQELTILETALSSLNEELQKQFVKRGREEWEGWEETDAAKCKELYDQVSDELTSLARRMY